VAGEFTHVESAYHIVGMLQEDAPEVAVGKEFPDTPSK
jgi:hypothetical protein